MQTFKQKMRGGREENVMLILYVELGTQSLRPHSEFFYY